MVSPMCTHRETRYSMVMRWQDVSARQETRCLTSRGFISVTAVGIQVLQPHRAAATASLCVTATNRGIASCSIFSLLLLHSITHPPATSDCRSTASYSSTVIGTIVLLHLLTPLSSPLHSLCCKDTHHNAAFTTRAAIPPLSTRL